MAKHIVYCKCKYYKPYMDTLKLLCEQFYQLDGCSAGGPLHILLDDDNYDLNSIHFCIKRCTEHIRNPEHFDPHACTIGLMICNEYAKMTLEERSVFDSYWCGYKLDCLGNCEECKLLGDVYEYMKEAEEAYGIR